MRKYRIVTDNYSGFEVQTKVWYWPFWQQLGFSNTYQTIIEAEKRIERDKKDRNFKSVVVKNDI